MSLFVLLGLLLLLLCCCYCCCCCCCCCDYRWDGLFGGPVQGGGGETGVGVGRGNLLLLIKQGLWELLLLLLLPCGWEGLGWKRGACVLYRAGEEG